MSDRIIQTADLHTIEKNLAELYSGLNTVNGNVINVSSKVDQVYAEIAALSSQLDDFRRHQQMENWLGQAKTDIVNNRAEIEHRFGHYKQVRRTSVGILQATDIGIVRSESMQSAGENLMLETPNYWLAPCLVALIAWINDDQELCQKGLREAIKRDDEKTSLFFALVCRRANRKKSCLLWTNRYLACQDEEDLDVKAIVILDAFTAGLLGKDSEGQVSGQIGQWLEHLSEKPGFVEEQIDRWSKAIEAKKVPYLGTGYTYLPKYSPTWPMMQEVMSGACLHGTIYDYFTDIFNQKNPTGTIKQQLDDILTSLVTEYDEEERPLRMEERLNQLIIDFDGDKPKAQQQMQEEKKDYEMHKDFTQLLTDAAMRPDVAHSQVSTRKFAIALSKDWIQDAYTDLTFQNQAKNPMEIEIELDGFQDKSRDGSEENQIVERYNQYKDQQKAEELKKLEPSSFQKIQHFIGAGLAVLGLVLCITGSAVFGFVALIAGAVMVYQYFKNQKIRAQNIANLEQTISDAKETNTKIIRALCAEIVDFRSEFAEKDSENTRVIDFLTSMNSQDYVDSVQGETRRVMV